MDDWDSLRTPLQEAYESPQDEDAIKRAVDAAELVASTAGEPPDVFVYNPGWPVSSTGGRSCCVAEVAPMGPMEQSFNEIRNDVLVYSPPVLESDVEVTGTVELVLFAATDAVDTDWTAKLVEVDGERIELFDHLTHQRVAPAGSTQP